MDGESQYSRSLTARARRTVLAQLVTEFIEILQEDRYRVTDIFQALSDYATELSGKIPEHKPIWEVVGDLLDLSAQTALVAFERPAVRRRHVMQQRIAEFVELLQDEGYAFADLLKALTAYCLAQSGKTKKKQKRSWESITTFLELAEVQAEKLTQPVSQETQPSRQLSKQAIANGSITQPVRVSQS